MTWSTKPLGEIATIERAGVDPRGMPHDLPYLGLEHIERGGRILGSQTVGEAQLTSTKFAFDEGHVLFGKLRPNLGKVARPTFRGVCSTDILPIRPGLNLDRAYLHHYLAQPQMVAFAASRTSGANLPRLSPTVLATFEIPLPPVDEQRRIAAILDQVDALRAKRRQSLAHLHDLTQSIFHDMFDDQPSEIHALGEVADFFGGASLPAGEVYASQPHGTLLMKVSDMNSAGNEEAVFKTSRWTGGSTGRSATVGEGAVVLPKRGASIATNKKRLTTRRTALDPNLMGVMPKPDVLTSRYLLEWFKSFDLASITSGSTVPQLNKQDLSPLSIPVPPLARQVELGQRLSMVHARLVAVDRSSVALDALFASLQGGAFSGRL